MLTNEIGEIEVDEHFRLVSDKGSIRNVYGLGPGFYPNDKKLKKHYKNSKNIDFFYQEACGKIHKNINDSLMTIEKGGQWLWFSSEEYSKSASLRKNIDFELNESDKFSVNSMDFLDLEAINMNKMSSKYKVDKGLL